MKKNYIVLFIFSFLFLIAQQGFSQSGFNNMPQQDHIDGLSIYPNPVNNGRVFVYITTNKNLTKHVEIFNVLGKQIYATDLSGKELNIAQLSTGVYILKITENNISETRKLVIK
ncbi:MAG: T9SS type A sorting domain-containing protein [Flavobacteriaceae bacterium]|jgi:hypothetical protein|nr:T9SS type A sorting domain-containing protein [Flavobacteriaceae bacterium]